MSERKPIFGAVVRLVLIVPYVTCLHKIVSGIFDIIPKTLDAQNEVNFNVYVLYLQIYKLVMVTEVPWGKNEFDRLWTIGKYVTPNFLFTLVKVLILENLISCTAFFKNTGFFSMSKNCILEALIYMK